MLPNGLSFNDLRDRLETAVNDNPDLCGDNEWCCVVDMTDTWVVWACYGYSSADSCWCQANYTVDDAGVVTVDPASKVEVQKRTSYDPIPADQMTEAVERHPGRILEARGSDSSGGRIFRMRIIEAGQSRNGRIYPLPVIHRAAPLYEGAKAFDGHRSDLEVAMSATESLIGYWSDIETVPEGLDGDLHLLPSAVRIAEALDASLAAQHNGLPPIVGVSHDVATEARKVPIAGGRNVQEVTQIVRVISADVVADPAAGGKALRMVASETGDLLTTPTDDPEEGLMTLDDLLKQIGDATPEQRAALAAALGTTSPDTSTTGDTAGELVTAGTASEARTREAAPPVASYTRESFAGRAVLDQAAKTAQLDDRMIAAVARNLPARWTEADLAAEIGRVASMRESFEKAGLLDQPTRVTITADALDKKRDRLYRSMCRDWEHGYTSIKEAFLDITGERMQPGILFGAGATDFAHRVIRESWAPSMVPGRATEALTTGSWGEILGDSIRRRLLDVYSIGRFADWRKVVSIVPLADFRTNRRVRMAGYGDLPTVNESAPYQLLTSPSDEEATYSPAKKGGIESITYETVMNDDLGAVARIPEALGRSAASTLYRYVFISLLTGNPTIYDSVALFHASHSNTTAVALGDTGLGTLRQKMRDQAEYGVDTRPIGLVPDILIVPNELEALAWQLTNAERQVPSSVGASDIPNFHQNKYQVIVVDELSDANDWFAMASPAQAPGIELGFLNGAVNPELFVDDDPRTGSMFSSDKVTWKIRHIYGGAVVDYRPFQRGTQ